MLEKKVSICLEAFILKNLPYLLNDKRCTFIDLAINKTTTIHTNPRNAIEMLF